MEFDGYRILQVTDVHLGRRTHGFKALERLKSIHADLIVVTGDLVHRSRWAPLADEFLGKLIATVDPPDGVLAVKGNHDAAVDEHLPNNVRVRWLNNETIQLRRGSEGLNLMGLDQQQVKWRSTDLCQALRGLESGNGYPTIVLGHYPATAVLVSSFADLVICGHTHAGQIKLPGLPFYTNDRLGWRFGHGLRKIGKAYLVVCAGLGFSGIPLRIGSRPEVAVITLVRLGSAAYTSVGD
jgi:hypothetical protein